MTKYSTTFKEAIIQFFLELEDELKFVLFISIAFCFCTLCVSSCTSIEIISKIPRHSRLAEQIITIDNAISSDEVETELIKKLMEKYTPENDSIKPNQKNNIDQLKNDLKNAGLSQEQINEINSINQDNGELEKKEQTW